MSSFDQTQSLRAVLERHNQCSWSVLGSATDYSQIACSEDPINHNIRSQGEALIWWTWGLLVKRATGFISPIEILSF